MIVSAEDGAELDAPSCARCQGRLQTLDRMGLAEKIDSVHWRLAPELRSMLREMGARGDRGRMSSSPAISSGVSKNGSSNRPSLVSSGQRGSRTGPRLTACGVSGTYRQTVQIASGKFAMLDDGVGFSLVPWRSVRKNRLGQSLSATLNGARISWEIGRTRGLSI
jgi:hypothetical protein